MDPKPGVATTEFWLSFAAVVLGAIMGAGILPETGWQVQLAGAALAALGALGYTASRGVVKAAAKRAEGPPVVAAPTGLAYTIRTDPRQPQPQE
ncbi:MAG TPA: hypothetical protein VK607_10450 [Kofleriaceae bacterium]|nr:hypothetical protein [Kofleriaceae bacterium]